MKKMFIGGAVALIMLGLMGCEEAKDAIIGDKPDVPVMSPGFTKGLTNFDVQTGDQAGEIKYKFSATDPASDSYTLYYMKGTINKAATIIASGKQFNENEPKVGGYTIVTAGGPTSLSDFTPGEVYSVVVEALNGDDYARSAVIPSVKAKSDQFELFVNNLDKAADGKIWGASLLSSSDSQTPIAIGIQINKAFVFYHPKEGNPPIDIEKPFTTPGTYALAIALTNSTTYQPEKIYMSNENITYSASITSITVNWEDFTEMGGGPTEPVETSTVITINNKPSNAGILAVMDGGTQIALGMNLQSNIFTLYEPGAMGPGTTLWKGTGNYSILLINIATQAPVASYVKMEGGTPNPLYNFTGQDAIILDYAADFVPLP